MPNKLVENPKPIISLMFGVSVGFWANELAEYIKDQGGALLLFETKEIVVLISGVLFLLDLLCIVWWYARYIYRVQPDATFGTYFLDFVICSMFALAANSWTEPGTFLLATLAGSSFLILRFVQLYHSSNVSLTDRAILRQAGVLLGVMLLLVLAGFGWVLPRFDDARTPAFQGPFLPGALSLVGIILTVLLRSKIEVAVDIYSTRTAGLPPTPLQWPKDLSADSDRRDRIRKQTAQGLKEFELLFEQLGRQDRLHSRVHSRTDLRVQSYILAIPSCRRQEYSEEIRMKAFMVGLSHWLDDLVDGRNEVAIWRALGDGLGLSDNEKEATELFERIYAPLIRKHSSKQFYPIIVDAINEACSLSYNAKYMFLGLNRIAYGAVMFSPRIDVARRRRLARAHSKFLKEWNVEKDPFTNEVESILDTIDAGGECGLVLLALTTKTVQELAFSSEQNELDVGYSLLFSILYAPLLYYHDNVEELDTAEMVPLEAFDTDYDVWIPWLQWARQALDLAEDDRRAERLLQLEMAYRCFEKAIPEVIRSALRPVYIDETRARDVEIEITPRRAASQLAMKPSRKERSKALKQPPAGKPPVGLEPTT